MAEIFTASNGKTYRVKDPDGADAKPVEVGDLVVITSISGVDEGDYQGEVFKVVNNREADGIVGRVAKHSSAKPASEWYVMGWAKVEEFEGDPASAVTREIGDTLIRAPLWCCPSLSQDKVQVVGVGSHFLSVTGEGLEGVHLVRGAGKSVGSGARPAVADFRKGMRVMVTNSRDYGSAINGMFGIVYRDGDNTVQIENRGGERIPHQYAISVREGGAMLVEPDSFGPTASPANSEVIILKTETEAGDKYIGSTATISEWVAGWPRALTHDGDYVRLREWIPIKAPDYASPVGLHSDNYGAIPDHRGSLRAGDHVRIVSARGPGAEKYAGEIAHVDNEIPKPGKYITAVLKDGAKVQVTDWCRVTPEGAPRPGRYLSHITEEQAAEVIQKLFEDMDALAEGKGWCNEYDDIMHKEVKRTPNTVRAKQDWVLEVDVTFATKKDERPTPESPVAQVGSPRYQVLAKGGRDTAPHTLVARYLLEQQGLTGIESVTTIRSWRA